MSTVQRTVYFEHPTSLHWCKPGLTLLITYGLFGLELMLILNQEMGYSLKDGQRNF